MKAYDLVVTLQQYQTGKAIIELILTSWAFNIHVYSQIHLSGGITCTTMREQMAVNTKYI